MTTHSYLKNATQIRMNNLRFSGHESFQCRNLWLKKGFEYVLAGKDFNDDLAVVDLGVGNNMVSSIKFWMKAFKVLDDDEAISTHALQIFNETGYDPYLEDIGTLWLLHFLLVKNESVTIYNQFFNYFRKQRIEFSRDHLLSFYVNLCNKKEENHSENTINTDIGVFLKTYVQPRSKGSKKSIEDDFSSMFIDLGLIKPIADTKDWYEAKSEPRPTLPLEIFLYSILSNNYGGSITLGTLLNGENSPGAIFALDADSLVEMIQKLEKKYDGIVFKDDAGIRVLQITKKFDLLTLLEEYYA